MIRQLYCDRFSDLKKYLNVILLYWNKNLKDATLDFLIFYIIAMGTGLNFI